MGEVATVIGGGTPKSDQPEYFGGDIPWITPADLSGYTEKFISAGARSITQAGLDNSGARVMPAGAVLFSSRAPIGYVAIAANPVSTNQGFKTFVLRDGLTSDFVYYYLQHAKKLAVEMASGTTFLEISGKKAAQLPIPVAPLPEQRRIVAEIEKQFTRLEAGVAALRRVQANLKRYRAAVLKAACGGKLVPTEAALARSPRSAKNGPPAYETGEALLARILTERRQNWQGRGQYKEPAAPDTAKLPTIPEGWTWATPDQLSAVEDGAICAGPFGTIFKAHDFRANGIPIIFLRHVAPGRYLTHKPGFMDAAKWEELFRPYSVFGGELLVTKLGEPPGVCAIYPKGIGPAMVTPDVMKMTPNPAAALPVFLMHYFNSQTARDFATGVAFGTTRLRLTLPIFREMPVPLPPLPEQTRIVAEVERRLSVVEELESVVSASLQRATRLRHSILQKAFAGQLTPQSEGANTVSTSEAKTSIKGDAYV
jgi:type I restriction enzyme, S subunit